MVELPHELRLPFVKWVAANQVLDKVFSLVYIVFLAYDMMSICVKLSVKLFLWKDRLGLNDVPLFLFLCTLGRDVSRVWKTNAIRLLCIGLFFHIRALAQNSPFLKIVFFSRVNMKKIIFVCRNRLLKGMRYHQYTGEQLAMQHQIGTFR